MLIQLNIWLSSFLLFTLLSSTYNHPLQSYINMANTQKPAANILKQPSAGTQPKVTAATTENKNIRPCSPMATRPALALKSSSNSVRDSKMDIESAALIASLWGYYFSLSLISLYNSSFFSGDWPAEEASSHQTDRKEVGRDPQPTKITSLQEAMGLSENKPLYSHCWVSHLSIFPYCIWLIINYIVGYSRRHEACRSTHWHQLAQSRSSSHREDCPSSQFRIISFH